MSSPDSIRNAIAAGGPGTTICVNGNANGLRDADLVVDRSGTAKAPIVLAGEGVTVRSVVVRADHVVVRGFTTVDGDGIVLQGRGLVVHGNTVRDARQDGISCDQVCADVLIDDNTVVGADGSGIIVEGQRIVVQGNAVSRSVRRSADDADGIRFFGSDVRLLRNTVADISAEGYGAHPPHTDCFQTFDNGRIPTTNAVISDNVCRNVDVQCLIATAQVAGTTGALGRSHGIRFTGNVCEVKGSQAVLVEWFPGVVVRGNRFDGPFDRAAVFLDGSTGGEFSDNSVPPGRRSYEVDGPSAPGFVTDVSGG